ncbi:MAG: DUF1929 domain-containing protein [Cyclobacteriaceae bacterium]
MKRREFLILTSTTVSFSLLQNCGPDPCSGWKGLFRALSAHMNGGSIERMPSLGLCGIHAAIGPNSEVIFFGYNHNASHRTREGLSQVFRNGTLNSVQVHDMPDFNPFCCGTAKLFDGSILTVGGHAPGQHECACPTPDGSFVIQEECLDPITETDLIILFQILLAIDATSRIALPVGITDFIAVTLSFIIAAISAAAVIVGPLLLTEAGLSVAIRNNSDSLTPFRDLLEQKLNEVANDLRAKLNEALAFMGGEIRNHPDLAPLIEQINPDPKSSNAVRILEVRNDQTQWDIRRKCSGARWYPTLITLRTGEVLINGGSKINLFSSWNALNERIEFFDPETRQVRTVPSFNPSRLFLGGVKSYPKDDVFKSSKLRVEGEGKRFAGLYPLQHIVPSRTEPIHGFIISALESFVRLYSPLSNQLKSINGETTKILLDRFVTWPTQGSSVLMPIFIDQNGNGPRFYEVKIFGGGTTGKDNRNDDAVSTSISILYDSEDESIRLSESREVPLKRPRFMCDAVLLPSLQVAIIGGSAKGYANDNLEKVKDIELHYHELDQNDPEGGGGGTHLHSVDTESQIERGYHATALLMQNGSVSIAGGTLGWPPMVCNHARNVMDFEIYHPPYQRFTNKPSVTFLSEGGDGCYFPSEGIYPVSQANLRDVSRLPIFIIEGNNEEDDSCKEIINQLILIRQSTTTHSLNTDQRTIVCPIEFIGTDDDNEEVSCFRIRPNPSDSSLNLGDPLNPIATIVPNYLVTLPRDGNILIPGMYYAYVRDKEMSISNGAILRVGLLGGAGNDLGLLASI